MSLWVILITVKLPVIMELVEPFFFVVVFVCLKMMEFFFCVQV